MAHVVQARQCRAHPAFVCNVRDTRIKMLGHDGSECGVRPGPTPAARVAERDSAATPRVEAGAVRAMVVGCLGETPPEMSMITRLEVLSAARDSATPNDEAAELA